jgi:DTW domain-containing protein
LVTIHARAAEEIVGTGDGTIAERGHREARPFCYRCDKPSSMCLCSQLTPIHNEVGVRVLQHPQERRHPIGTTRLLRLGLADVRVHVVRLSGKSAATPPVDLPAGAGLLYPSADARDLASLAVDDRPSQLVVIDGTWTQAHRLFRDNPWIAALPRFRLPVGEGSRYRIRAEPRLECLSTVESVVVALRLLQPDLRGTETLLSAFDAMIDTQIEASAQRSPSTRRTRVRRRPPRPIPDALLAPDARIVVVYTEASPRENEVSRTRPPLRISAVSLDGTRVFDRVIQVPIAPDAFRAGRMGIERSAIEAGRPCGEVMTAFQEFCWGGAADHGAPPVLVAWNIKTFRWFEESMANVRCVALKGVWANVSQSRVPELETLVNSLDLAPPDLPVTGRAGRRLTHAHAMARHILNGAADAR